MTAPRIRWRGTVVSRGEAAPLLGETGDVVLVSRAERFRWLVFRCPSGCGTELPINLDPRSGPAWRLYDPGNAASLYPSVWRDSGCGAHFILSRGSLWVITDEDRYWTREPDEALITHVRSNLTIHVRHYYEIAEAIGAEPWETLSACRRLVRGGAAREGVGGESEHFRRA